MCFSIRHGKRLGETLKLPRLLEAATSRLGLGSDGLVHIPGKWLQISTDMLLNITRTGDELFGTVNIYDLD